MWQKRRVGYTCNVCAFSECLFTDTCNRIRNSYTVTLQMKFMYKSGADIKKQAVSLRLAIITNLFYESIKL